MSMLKVGEIGYMIESNRFIREVKVTKCSGGIYQIKFLDTGGGIQVKAHRLHARESEAMAELDEIRKRQKGFCYVNYEKRRL